MSSTSNADGGALIFDEYRNTIIDLVQEYGVFRRYAEIAPMASDTVSWPRVTGGATGYFPAENSSTTESSPTFDYVSLTAREAAVLTAVPKTLAEDAVINLADLVTRKIAQAFAEKEDRCGFLGDGTSTYAGIYGVFPKIDDGNHTASLVEAASGNTAFSTLDLTDFEAVVGALPEYPGMRPAWFISKAGWAAAMMRLADSAGGNTTQNIVNGVPQASFMGYPVVWSQVCNSTLTAQTETVLCVFGDLSMAATFGDRRVATMSSDSGGTYFAKRQVAIQGTERFDISVHDLGDTSNAGPLVGLKTPAS